MAEKLKSIINPIPWSLLLKPFAIAMAWLVFPWWAFLIVALYCYLIPFFRPFSLAPAFSIFLFMALATPAGFFRAIYAGIILALIFGIKDFVIVNRKVAYQLLVLLISFAACFMFFSIFSSWSAPSSFYFLALLSFLWFWLLNSAPEKQDISVLPPAIAALILFEIGAVILFLPINFFAQGTLLFFASALILEAAINLKTITFKQASFWAIGYAATCLLVVFLASWKV